MVEWLNQQDPLVLVAIAFVAGGLAQGAIDLIGREVGSRWDEKRLFRRERRKGWLDAIEDTHKHTITYGEYLIRRSGTDGGKATYDSSQHVKARLGLIGDTERLRRFQAVVAKFYARLPGDPVPAEDVIELFAAREAVENALAEQGDRVLSGKEPVLIPAADVEAITAIEPMIRDQVARAMREQVEARKRNTPSGEPAP